MVDIYTPWDIKELLKEWKLENILPHLMAEKVDAEILEMMKLHHIRMLLCNFPLGVQIRFEHNLERWRYNIGKPFYVYKCCQQDVSDFICKPTYDNKVSYQRTHNENTNFSTTQHPPPQEQQQQIKVIQIETAMRNLPTPQDSPEAINDNNLLVVSNTTPPETPITNRSVASSSGSPTRRAHSQALTLPKDTPMSIPYSTKQHTPIPKVNLHEILMKSKPEGSQFIKIYNVRKAFTKPERRSLLNVIVTYYLRNELRFDLQTSYALELAILKMFPNERLDMYRKHKRGSIYCKYMNAKKIFYNLKQTNANDLYMPNDNDDTFGSSDMETISFTNGDEADSRSTVTNAVFQDDNVNIDESEEFSYCLQDDSKINLIKPKIEVDSEIPIQTAYRLHREVITLTRPISYQDFLSKACDAYSIPSMDDHYLAVNDCEISEMEFRNVIMQYYKLSTFVVEVKQKPSLLSQLDLNDTEEIAGDGISIQIDENHLPDANEIRNIPTLLHVVGMSDSGKTLENKYRNAIAKAVIDECLSYQPDRLLKRQDFMILAQNICQAFPNEEESTYFTPSTPKNPSRGKIWCAFNNKRSFLCSSGMAKRRCAKRRKTMDVGDFNRRLDIEENEDTSLDFTETTNMDWDYLTVKWSETHERRWLELKNEKLTASEYMERYSILRSARGITLMEIDVNILHPTVLSVSNWLTLYLKVVEKARGRMRRCEILSKIIKAIEQSTDERYSAGLALLLIPYIFPHNGRRNELNGGRASKSEIQQTFINEYNSLEDLRNDLKPADLQIRFVHSNRRIIHSEFAISGLTFQCADLMESLSSLFHYMLAMDIKYPKNCCHVWQFVQYAIFHIPLQEDKLPYVESTISDLHLS